MKYLIIGAGGIGGAIGAYLSVGGKDVSIIARGDNLRNIQKNGLTLRTVNRGELTAKNIKAYAAEDDFEKSDIIFVCVKGYSLADIIPVIDKAAHEKTVVIPILNSLSAGKTIGEALPKLCALGGCIYTSSYISGPGVITQPTPLFRIVFGARAGLTADTELLGKVSSDLNECGVECLISPDIERDIFKKLAFVSPFAVADSYFDVSAGELQKAGEKREMFISLVGEMLGIAAAKKLNIDIDLMENSTKLLDGLAPEVTSSMHKDILAGKNFEKQELIFDLVEAAQALGVQVPQYTKAAIHFGYEPRQ